MALAWRSGSASRVSCRQLRCTYDANSVRTHFAKRFVTTLQQNPHIYAFPNSRYPGSHILSLLPTDPPVEDLAIGVTTKLPATPATFTENPKFLSILQEVLARHAFQDAGVKSQAQAMASPAGSGLGSGGVFFPNQRSYRRKTYSGGGGAGGDGAGGASAQGGAGGGGVGGWVHVSDTRNPPDFGRIPFPEDIFGSVQVNGEGEFVGEGGSYQPSGTYRIVTREGFLGLTDFLRERVVRRLKQLEAAKS